MFQKKNCKKQIIYELAFLFKFKFDFLHPLLPDKKIKTSNKKVLFNFSIEPTLLKTIKFAMEEQRQQIEVCIGNLHKMPTSNFYHAVPKPHENYEFLIAHGKIEDAIDQVTKIYFLDYFLKNRVF